MSWLSKMFGGNQKRDTTYQGPQAPSSLMSVTGGPEYYKTISNRLAGQGVGYGDQYANRVSSPIIARMRNQFNSYDIPELKSELSATGRRRGSGGFDQLRRAYQEQGLNEGDVYANLYRENEGQKRTEVNDALNKLGDFNKNEYNVASNYATDQYGKYKDNLGEAEKQRSAGNDGFGRLLGTGGYALSLMSGGMPSLSSPQASSTQSYLSRLQPQQPSYYYPGVQTLSSKFGQYGGVQPYSTRIK